MARDWLIIDITASSVKAGVARAGAIVQTASRPIEAQGPQAPLREAVAELASKHGPFARCVAGLPPSILSLRILDLPFDNRKKLEEVLPYVSEDLFIHPPEELLLNALPLEGGKTLVAAAGKEAVKDYLSIIKGAGVDPDIVGFSLLSKAELLKSIGIEDGVFMDDISVMEVSGGRPVFLKTLRGPQEAATALEAIGATDSNGSNQPSGQKKVYAPAGATFEGAGPVEAVSGYDPDTAGLGAFAAHLASGAGTLPNFRKGELAGTRGVESIERWFKIFAALSAVFVIAWGFYVYLRYSTVSSAVSESRKDTGAAYAGLFKGEKAVDPLYQLEVKLKAARDERRLLGGGSMLDTIRALSEAAGEKAGIRIRELNVAGGRLTAACDGQSFDQANRFKDSAVKTGYFNDAAITDARSGVSGGVAFSFTAKAGGAR